MRIFALALILVMSLKGYAWEKVKEDFYNPIRTAVTSINIAPDANGSALGDQGVAMRPDTYSQYWNPAKYAMVENKSGWASTYTPWLRSIVDDIALFTNFGYYHWKQQSVAASVSYFKVGDVTTADESMTIRPFEITADVSYSRRLTQHFSMGVMGRYMYSDMSGHAFDDMRPGHAFSFGLSGFYRRSFLLAGNTAHASAGFNISDIGSKINFGDDYSYFIPAKLRLGASVSLPVHRYHYFTISGEMSKLLVPAMPLQHTGESDVDYNDRLTTEYYDCSSIKGVFKSFGDSPRGFRGEMSEILWSIGLEYRMFGHYHFSAGYHHESDWEGGRRYFTMGTGINFKIVDAGISYTKATSKTNPLDKTLRLSLGFKIP